MHDKLIKKDGYYELHLYVRGNHVATTLFSENKLEKVKQGKWYAYKAQRYIYGAVGNKQRIYLHRYLMDAPKGSIVDHINGNRLDNRDENLRFVNGSQNRYNSLAQKTNRVGIKGVIYTPTKSGVKYRSEITVGGEKIYLGYFHSLEEAIKKRKEAERKYHGSYVRR